MSKQVMKCCHGFEQVGSYCALSLNRSAEFTSKPGLCPSTRTTGSLRNNSSFSSSVCNWDIDCPLWQKCCPTENTSSISQCSDPVPLVNRTWCFNASITVKTTYELVTMDKGLFNHTRLLHSVVTGALGTNEISVHHVWSWPAGPFTTSSSLLVCSSKVIFLEDISTKLYQLANIEEVTNVEVQDVDECAALQLSSCSPDANCTNTVGSYSCICHHGYHDLNTSQPGTDCIAPIVTTKPLMNTTTPSWTTHSPTDDQTDGGQMSTVTLGPVLTITNSQTSSTCGYTPKIISILSYNVTGSSFSVIWTTNIQTGVIFQLVLLDGTSEIQNLPVMSYNWTFTDLSPAVLYTVRVTPAACGNQGNTEVIKVRTDGQSLGATACLKGENYTEELRDPTSDAYKTFCDAVIDEILKFLPSEISELVASGQVIIQITSLSPGSVIVNFSVIFHSGSNLNISSVSSALMVSLQNSKYKVDNSSIYISDPDECFRNETDCSPWAYCTNTFGSYNCSCWSGYTDLKPSRPGRSCAASPTTRSIYPTTNYSGVSLDSTATATTTSPITNPSMSSTVSTTHVKTSTTTTVSSTFTATNGLTTVPTNILATTLTPAAQNFVGTTTQASISIAHLISYLSVECSPQYVTVFIKRIILQSNDIPESSLYLSKPECGPSGINDTYVWLTTFWKTCGTTFAHNSTHNFANVTLYNNVSSSFSVRLEVPVICTYPSHVFISTGYAPSGHFNMINDPVGGSGSFQVILRLLNGTFPLPENYTFSPEEEVFLEVEVNTAISQIKVIIDTCWATTSNDSTMNPQYFFMLNRCPKSGAYTTVHQNGNGTVSLLSVQIFKLVKQYIIYLHCEIQICIEIQEGSCRPHCTGVRTYRSSDLTRVTKASIGPLKSYPTIQTDTSNTLQTIGFVLLGIGVFLLSLAAIAGLVYHKRKIGNYNFRCKPQQQNFTYHVFDT
ncbi:hypothetical protein Q8A67_023570 [Cirrhinus molitorella]|nr:hypothetical protein Q8A67_023570 [Cirrhinus molitorella]